MHLDNNYSFLEMKEIMSKLKEQSEIIKNSLEQMDVLMKESIGESGDAWQGIGTSEVRNIWDEYAENIKEYINMINSQYNNLEKINEVMNDDEGNKS